MDPRRKKIRKLFIDADIPSVSEAARLIGVSQSHLWRVLEGERLGAPTRAALEALLEERLGKPISIPRAKAA